MCIRPPRRWSDAQACVRGSNTHLELTGGQDGRAAGALFETFVATEIHKQASWSEPTVSISHFRDRNGAEVDLVIEDRKGTTDRHARHLALLRDRLPKRFTVGLVVQAGAQVLPLGDRLWALPVSALWRDD
ncbi:MAG: DUF4143 domain-containing protein [Acidimicrobiia bacterium]